MTKITIEIDDDDAREALEWAGEVTALLEKIVSILENKKEDS
tara:strand:+ start:247 stop:372 length:126 start_codon:yes stop_codon:yes gene_type:complete